jgi:hypothetical protein
MKPHFEILVEEPSMEAFLRKLLPRMLGDAASFKIYPHQCKDDLLKKLPERLVGYKGWLPPNYRILVLVDRDNDDCAELKHGMENMAAKAGLTSRSSNTGKQWLIANRIAVEELEAWYFGDWTAVRKVYPKVPETIPNKRGFRDPDAIVGGTWEALERLLKQAGYFANGLRKTEIARELGEIIDFTGNRSRSFQIFRDALLEATS